MDDFQKEIEHRLTKLESQNIYIADTLKRIEQKLDDQQKFRRKLILAVLSVAAPALLSLAMQFIK